MPTSISMASKLKPVQLMPLKQGNVKIAVTEPIATLKGQYVKALQAISTALAADLENAADTAISFLILDKCTTQSDAKPQLLPVIIPPAKEPQFKIKALSKAPEVKKSKQMAVCQLIATGEQENDLHVLTLVKRSGKLKITPQLLNLLNKVARKKSLMFQLPVQEEVVAENVATEVATEPRESNPLEAIIDQLDITKDAFDRQPSKVTLKAMANKMGTLKAAVQDMKQTDPRNYAAAKQTFVEWMGKFNLAKKQLLQGNSAVEAPQATEEETQEEGLAAQITQLEKARDKTAKNLSFDSIIALLSECQKIRTNPQNKLKFKEDRALLKRFKALRASLASLIENNFKASMEEEIQNPEIFKTNMKNEVMDVWEGFINEAEDAATFEIIANQIMPNFMNNIKGFQKKVSQKAQGFVEASKLVELGDSAEISANMTTVRSGLTKLKTHMQEQFKAMKKATFQMAKLEAEHNATEDEAVKSEKREAIRAIADSLDWKSIWNVFAY